MDGAGARAPPAAPERLPEERSGAGEGQKAKGRAAIAREEGGARRCPHTHTPPPAVTPLCSSLFLFLFCCSSTQKPHTSHPRRQTVRHLILGRGREEKHAGNMLSHCHRKNTTVLKCPCSHTEPIWWKEKNTISLTTRGEHCVLV